LNSENYYLLKDVSVLDPVKMKYGGVLRGETEVRRVCRRFSNDVIQAVKTLRD
jgi:hypothetical protein